ncbi:MAG: hypothetical protein JW810_06540 [Sedimentisphaerales bacterium]|nr:hypothetical protein [Sedimentisphaerales bacterium]
MKIFLNNLPLDESLEDDLTLGEALTNLQKRHVTDDAVISAICIDGEPLTAELLSCWKDRPVCEFAEAHIEAPKRHHLAAQGMRLLAEALCDSQDDRRQIVDHLGQARPQPAMEMLTDYLNLWNTIQLTLASAGRLLETDLDELPLDDSDGGDSLGQVGDRITQLSNQLQELKAALEAQDLVLLGDILEYEFGPLTEDWQDMLGRLAERFAACES